MDRRPIGSVCASCRGLLLHLAQLAHKITKLIERQKLTQAEAADVLEVDQPKVSALKRGKLSGSLRWIVS